MYDNALTLFTLEQSLWHGYKQTLSRLMSDILSPCLDELSVVRDCATDCVSPLRGCFVFVFFFFFKFMVLPIKAIQDVKSYKRVLDKTDVITWCLNLHKYFCACAKVHSVIHKVRRPQLNFYEHSIQQWILKKSIVVSPKILILSRTTVTIL